MSAANIMAGLLIGLAFLASLRSTGPAEEFERLWIETSSGTREFSVEVASSREEQSRGLMYRRSMETDHGMLFTMKPPREVTFWMKNTYIPLDMLFLGTDGTILQIEEMTEPETEFTHRSVSRVSGVLEINGGLSQKLGITVGDVVRHSFFRNLVDCSDETSQIACR